MSWVVSQFAPIPQAVAAATAAATFVMGAFPKTVELLEKEVSKKKLAAGERKPLYDISGFQIAWPLMLMYGAVMLTFVSQAFSFIMAALDTAGPGDLSKASAGLVASNIATIFGAYFVGRWIGRRTSRLGIVAALLLGPFTAAATIGLDLLLVPSDTYKSITGLEPTFSANQTKLIAVSIEITVAGLIGYWRGHKQRLLKYLGYLLSVVDPETREQVVGLAYDEAQRATAAVGRDLSPKAP